ncbi:MAG: hypothetical protein QGI45_00755, partial [Myxococcota bacterium]|nr:hypothetical protein [Myxococcota bacterium]
GRILWTADNLFGDIRFGGRFSPSPHDDAKAETHDGHSHTHGDEDEHVSLVVSPHSDQEFIYRASIGYAWFDHLFSTLIYTDGQIVMAEEDKGDVYLSSGFAAVLPLFDALHLRLDTQIPISARKRFDWRSTVEAHLLF